MKTKTLIMGMALGGALLLSAPMLKANAFLEVSSGATVLSTSAAGSQSVLQLGGPIGKWAGTTVTTGDASDAPLDIDVGLGGSGTGAAPLEIIFSTGLYSQVGAWQLVSSSTTRGVTVSLSAYAGTSLYTGGSLAGLQLLGSQTLAESLKTSSGILHSPLDYYTEIITITPSSDGKVTASFDSSFGVPDGGTTMLMLGSVLAGLTGLRSKFGAKNA
jgi:hypothetical protein